MRLLYLILAAGLTAALLGCGPTPAPDGIPLIGPCPCPDGGPCPCPTPCPCPVPCPDGRCPVPKVIPADDPTEARYRHCPRPWGFCRRCHPAGVGD